MSCMEVRHYEKSELYENKMLRGNDEKSEQNGSDGAVSVKTPYRHFHSAHFFLAVHVMIKRIGCTCLG